MMPIVGPDYMLEVFALLAHIVIHPDDHETAEKRLDFLARYQRVLRLRMLSRLRTIS